MSHWSQLSIERQVQLADKFNKAFRGVGSMVDLRCSCGAWEKVEGALERITESSEWEALNAPAFMCFMREEYSGLSIIEGGPIGQELDTGKNLSPCDILGAIISLSHKVNPPKPKEREWRVGDELETIEPLTAPFRAIIKNEQRSHKDNNLLFQFLKIGVGTISPYYLKSSLAITFRNLTIEAEQAGEKE